MLEFFSTRLGMEFPWPKYSQVIVRDFVSGAMENTTAVIHGDMLFYDAAKALTEDHEEVIAHELFHHWFGDLVTCESWAQLPLNESFADYSEYLWLEYSRGVEAAENHRREAYSTYLAEAREKKVPLIRFTYKDPMDMFDAHSYQKGGLTLHLLRQLVGDSAFFLSLRQYLTDNAYRAADIDHLRHAFEKVTGEDWTWFFDQHFRRSDEVRLLIRGEQRGDTAEIQVFQRDYDTLRGPYLYYTQVAVNSQKGYEEIPFLLRGDTSFTIVRPSLRFADVDPKRLFIGRVTRTYPSAWWENLLTEGRYFWARTQALQEVQPYLSGDSDKLKQVLTAYSQGGPVWRAEVWQNFQFLVDSEAVSQVLPLARQAIRDTSARVRYAAWEFIVEAARQALHPLDAWASEIQAALQEESSDIRNIALSALFLIDTTAAVQEAQNRLKAGVSDDLFIGAALMLIVLEKDTTAVLQLLNRYPCFTNVATRSQSLAGFVLAYEGIPSVRSRLLPTLHQIARTENPWYLRLTLVQYLKSRLGRDPDITRLLRQLKEEETHPILRSVYQRML
jgi:aminopeptidase N